MADKKGKITIYDISKKSGVSIATVSRVLNQYNNVNPETRDRVMQVMDEMGYKPNAFARGLGLDTMKTIGILCADSSDIYLAKAVYHIEQQLRANQYDSLLCCTGYNPEDKRKALDLLISKKVDAAILVGSTFLDSTSQGNKYIRDAAANVPVMLLNAHYDHQNVYSVYCDDFTSMKRATDYLIENGRKNILYMYNSKSYSGLRKLEGYRKSLEEHGIAPNKDLMQLCAVSREDIGGFVEFLENLSKSGVVFDAVLASEDNLAIAALKYAAIHGIRVPDDLAIIGYNNSILATVTEPELSSVDNKLEPMCRQLVDTLLGVLSGREMPRKTEYSGELVTRQTT